MFRYNIVICYNKVVTKQPLYEDNRRIEVDIYAVTETHFQLCCRLLNIHDDIGAVCGDFLIYFDWV